MNVDTKVQNNRTLNISILIDGCKELGLPLSDRQQWQFVRFYEMLIETNKVMNLTAVTEWDEVQTKHYLDSLLLCKVTDLSKIHRVLDLGTGAGFPGIPLKIVFPDIQMVLADSLNKRIRFLDQVISGIGLSGIDTVHGRAEDLGKMTDYRENFDLVVSRAVAGLPSLCEYCLPFVKTGGRFISYKAVGVEKEVEEARRAVQLLGGGKPVITTLPMPCTELSRAFVQIRKERRTPEKYPRKAGTPSRDPLK